MKRRLSMRLWMLLCGLLLCGLAVRGCHNDQEMIDRHERILAEEDE